MVGKPLFAIRFSLNPRLKTLQLGSWLRGDRDHCGDRLDLIHNLLSGLGLVWGVEDRTADHQVGGSGGNSIPRRNDAGLVASREPCWANARRHDGETLTQRLPQFAGFLR